LNETQNPNVYLLYWAIFSRNVTAVRVMYRLKHLSVDEWKEQIFEMCETAVSRGVLDVLHELLIIAKENGVLEWCREGELVEFAGQRSMKEKIRRLFSQMK
jgi:hypothetical protein